jgi:hypothetical protein
MQPSPTGAHVLDTGLQQYWPEVQVAEPQTTLPS